ncbi:hypothetical protein HYX08_02855 [Candidatus Woesearchaeota archaeon]|nr:hypothetical protein [Candidatus Woesearchaeota archaeon]
MPSKRGQIGLFLILGFVVFVAFGFIYYVYGISKKDNVKVEAGKTAMAPFSAENSNNFLVFCLKDLASEAIDYLSMRGGYFTLPKKSYSGGIINTPFYFYEDAGLLPNIEVWENSISQYINTYGDKCFEELKNITEYGDVSYELENTSTKILGIGVFVNVRAPAKIFLGPTTSELSRFDLELNSRLYDFYAFSDYLIKKQIEDKYSICLSCIVNSGTEMNFSVDIENAGDGVHLFSIQYNDSLKGMHKFMFASKFREISCASLPIDAEENLLDRIVDYCAKAKIESYNYSLSVKETRALWVF